MGGAWTLICGGLAIASGDVGGAAGIGIVWLIGAAVLA